MLLYITRSELILRKQKLTIPNASLLILGACNVEDVAVHGHYRCCGGLFTPVSCGILAQVGQVSEASASAKQLCAKLSETSASAKLSARSNRRPPPTPNNLARSFRRPPPASNNLARSNRRPLLVLGRVNRYIRVILFPVAGRRKSYWRKCQPPA